MNYIVFVLFITRSSLVKMLESYEVILNYAICINNRLPTNVPRGTNYELYCVYLNSFPDQALLK